MTASPADSCLVSEFRPSPNHGPRAGGREPDLLVLHYTGMPSTAEALARLCDPAAEVSSHYLVREDGTVVQMVAEARRAWHAGASCWAGEGDVNSRSIGIEIANPGHDFGTPPYPDAQIEAVIALARDIVLRRRIRADHVLGHSDVAPARKRDPGEGFPWRRLAAGGVGLWVEPVGLAEPGPVLAPGDRGDDVAALQAALADYGFPVPRDGVYEAEMAAVVAAFQRHFRPARIDGIADASTRATLTRLRAARARLITADPVLG
jgi:N-acetylmuramoyl-L-alanine amidase